VTQVAYPLHFDGRGLTATTNADEHLHELIEQVLFTSPGERVNRPTFGSGLLQLVFAPTGSELAATTEFLVQGALQQWLGDLIEVEALDFVLGEGSVTIKLTYLVRRTQERAVAEFSRTVAAP
jgi:phage baseplate assembly protein W